ncbi:MAG: hypothetical protein FPO08_16685 [Geobacter sp.]|nr:MAG: hypothetical protein FPO08_16685 [Geobacter sp.]
MFIPGNYYLEQITTSGLTFTDEGMPVVSEMQHGRVYEIDNPATVDELKRLESVKVLKPNCGYVRFFQAPVPKFDSEGRLESPRFHTIAFYEWDQEFAAVVRPPFNSSEICKQLPDAVVALFGAPEEVTLVRMERTNA